MSLFTEKSLWIMARLMRAFPISEEDAAAICGNLGHETGGFKYLQEIKPTVPGSKGGYGWAQWTGPRRRAFEAFCKVMKLQPSSDEANYGFLVEELKTTEKAAIPAVKNAKGLEAKVIAFERAYERAGVKHYPSRLKYAQQALAAYRARSVPPPDVPPVEPKPPSVPAPVAAGGIVAVILAALYAAWDRVVAFLDFIWPLN